MLPLHHHGPNIIVLLTFPTPTIGIWYTVIIFKLSGVYQNISTVSIFKLSGVYQNISTAVLQLFCGIVFSNPPTYSLWSERVKSSVHTAQQYHHIYVGFQNIVIIAALPRVRWHRASSPQGSSSDGCCLCITAAIVGVGKERSTITFGPR